ncbi:MAG: hypothetical protein JKY37_28875 [Nannocystaceae bacterium]|nr:hypothetical protein [Nannocystaceae bacterium]
MTDVYNNPALERDFSEAVWRRGRRYFFEHRVTNLEWVAEQDAWEASVHGTQRTPYTTWLAVERRALVYECDCPAPSPCEHIAALLLAVRAHDKLPGTQPDTQHAPSRLDQEVQALKAWTRRVDPVPPSATAPSSKRANQRRLVFVVALTADTGPRELAVEVLAGRVLKNGRQGKSQHFPIDRVLSRESQAADFVDPADRLLCFRLTQLGPAHMRYRLQTTFERNAAGTALFGDFVRTGRCYFDSSDTTPLEYGPTVNARVLWRADDSGAQRLAIRTDDAHARALGLGEIPVVLPLEPPHYLDPDTGLTGPLVVDVAPEVATAVLDIPELGADTVSALPDDLRSMLERYGLPQPLHQPIRRLEDIQPRPVLSLGTTARRRKAAEQRPGSQQFKHAIATVRFEYGPLSVDGYPRTSGDVVSEVIEGVVVSTPRDRDRESQWLERLDALGFQRRLDADPSQLQLPTDDDWLRLCGEDLGTLQDEGWRTEVAPDFPLEFVATGEWFVQADADKSDWLSVAVGVEVDGQRVNVLPAVEAAIRDGRLGPDTPPRSLSMHLTGGRWISLPAERLKQIVDTLVELFNERLEDGKIRLSTRDSGRLIGLVGLAWHGDKKLKTLAERLARTRALPRVAIPRTLKTELREYQARGLDWLSFLRAQGFGGVLADDMGLGKTVQALAHLLVEKRAARLDRPCLVVAPRSVLHNWARECARFAPSLPCAIYHGPDRAEVLRASRPQLVITTYALLSRDVELRQTKWHIVILDEAQAIKNPRTRVAAAARALDARQRICLSGTPMENNLEELWSLFTFVAPGLLGDIANFRSVYRSPIERHGDAGRLAALSTRIAPFMLRRTKQQVLPELPPKTEILVSIPLHTAQRDLYESVRMTMEKRVRRALEAKGLAKSHIIVLDALLKLRQVCCHPSLVKQATAKQRGAPSAKTERLLELLTELHGQGRRAIIFSQFTSMLDIVAQGLDAQAIGYRQITGKTTHRQDIVDAFQAAEFPMLLISLKAGGTGLNLTAADTVIHYDP